MNLIEFKESILRNSSKTDWELHESNMEKYDTIATLKEDLSISLRYSSEYVVSDFKEDWANIWPNPMANSIYIDFCFNGEVIFQELVVSIDGGKGLILCPSIIFEDNKIMGYEYSQENYDIAKIIEKLFSCHDKDVDMVMNGFNWIIKG